MGRGGGRKFLLPLCARLSRSDVNHQDKKEENGKKKLSRRRTIWTSIFISRVLHTCSFTHDGKVHAVQSCHRIPPVIGVHIPAVIGVHRSRTQVYVHLRQGSFLRLRLYFTAAMNEEEEERGRRKRACVYSSSISSSLLLFLLPPPPPPPPQQSQSVSSARRRRQGVVMCGTEG